ncbi:MAG: 6,7-dimethyl-8-ribityllumazine synthase [Actinomycetota bacterium]|nr:6,7-dimethyl-8-ribityllumazine synthase [Actinomycetota bacterium]
MRQGYAPGQPDATGLRIGIVASRFNPTVVGRLLDGAVEALQAVGARRDDVQVWWVPGAFEIPLLAHRLAASGSVDCVVALGAVIRGETPHFDFVAGEATRGCGAVAREFGIAVGFGIITTDTVAQAEARAGGTHGNKGAEAALAAVETTNLLAQFRP